MKLAWRAEAVRRLPLFLLTTLTSLVVLDLVYGLASSLNLRAYHLAPKNESFMAEDDPAYFLTGLVARGTSLLRDLVLVLVAAAIAVQVVRMRGQERRARALPVVGAVLVGAVVVSVEVVRICAGWNETHPTAATNDLSLMAAALNAAAVIVLTLAAMSVGPTDKPEAPRPSK
jgi:hypothetical protein